MKKVLQLLLITCCIGVVINSVYAERVPDRYLVKSTQEIKASAALCAPGGGFEMMAVNNVRARVNTSGDMWQNFATGIAQYFIPANTNQTSLFAGALWIGGVDLNNQLKLAAQRFRQVGVDYWPGPLTTDNTASITAETCVKWDKMFHVTKAEVSEFIGWYNSSDQAGEYPGYKTPQSITDWPAHPQDPNQAHYLAPFFDNNGDGEYNPDDGDYPYYDFDNVLCPLNYVGIKDWKPTPTMGSADYRYNEDSTQVNNPYKTETGGLLSDQVIKGDETFWWVFNDKGNAHGESKGQPIGLEIRAQAFAFATNDEVNNMTFYSYEIINRSTFILTNTYFSPWTDPDLGYGYDDYVGCDVERGMGYCYNGKNTDGTGQVEAYGEHPPAVGIDFFQGPYLDPNGYDNPSFKTKDYQNGVPLGGPSFQGDCQIVSSNNKMSPPLSWKYYDQSKGAYFDTTASVMVKAEAINGVNFGNGIPDDERYGMRRFVYYNNSLNGINGEPGEKPTDYYNYLRGIWKNGARMRHDGKDATSAEAAHPITDFMFPGTTDVCRWGVDGKEYPSGTENWTEETAKNDVNDRRFMQSAGPFTLNPGAVNYITFGVPWARDFTGDAWASVKKLKEADDKCQALFDNCFKVLDGPNAPDMYFVELDQKIIIHLRNDGVGSNNRNESYQEEDNTIVKGDSLYRFEGYQIYQLANSSIGPDDIGDISKARQIAQYDIANGVGRLVNFEPDAATEYDKPVLRVDGADQGISHTFEVTTDAFASGSNVNLVNNKQYYFLAIAYAYNNYQTFDPANTAAGGQRYPYLSGRTAAGNKKLAPKVAIPHKTIKGQALRSKYGDMPSITRIEGQGNSSNWLEISDETKKEILLPNKLYTQGMEFGDPNYPIAYKVTYKPNAGPVTVKVIDPLKVTSKSYILRFIPSTCTDTYNPMTPATDYTYAYYINSAEWELIDSATNKVIPSDNIKVTLTRDPDTAAQLIYASQYEQLYPDLGISITIKQTLHPGDYWIRNTGNGYLGYSATFADSTKKWLTGIMDQDIPGTPINWIRSGSYYDAGNNSDPRVADYNMITRRKDAEDTTVKMIGYLDPWDPKQNFEKIFDGTWAPLTLCAAMGADALTSQPVSFPAQQSEYGPVTSNKDKPFNFMTSIGSVDIVFTPDKNLWTRCVVLEMGRNYARNQGGAEGFTNRNAPSVDKQGNTAANGDTTASNDPNHPNYISGTGMSWFPGYAINVDTGERLNIMFGENSFFSAHNGRDMRFNPTSVIRDANDNYFMGGQHYVYIMGHKIIYNPIQSTESPTNAVEMPPYDAGATYRSLFNLPRSAPPGPAPIDVIKGKYSRRYVMSSCMYIGMPIPTPEYETMFDYWITGDNKYKKEGIDNDPNTSTFTLKIRVGKPFARYSSEIWTNPKAPGGGYNIPVAANYASNLVNDNWPMYSFSTKGLDAYVDNTKLKTDVDLVSVTPNPYYAYSNYERSALDNRVRFANLPPNTTISIYNVGGTLIQQFYYPDSGDSDHTSGGSNHLGNTLDWDLTNFAGVPIAGGSYIIHFKTPNGEKVIKWFGVMRTVDLTTF